MSIKFYCEQCAKPFEVADDLAGRKAKCGTCGHHMQIPSGSGANPGGMAYTPSASSGTNKTSKGAIVGGVLLGLFILRIVGMSLKAWRVAQGPEAPVNNNNPPAFVGPEVVAGAPGHPGDRAPGPDAPFPAFPERTAGKDIEPGVSFQIIKMGPNKPGPGVPPAHGMTLWLYLPKTGASAFPAEKSLPCVLIAPAGSILITGNELTGDGVGDHPEHLPWVRRGYAVLAYGLDGELPEGESDKPDSIRKASDTFLAAKSGLTNAKVAMEWLLAKVPEVDPNRIYTAGHSSAGTMALLLAENESRIRATIAFNPAADIAARFNEAQKRSLRPILPSIDQFFTTYNPANHIDRLNVPIFLFAARDDSNVTIDQVETFAQKVRSQAKNLTFEIVNEGGHYQSMIDEGIPKAIEWLNQIDRGRH